MKINNTFAIGCLVQWYEIEMIEDYINSLKQSLDQIENKENVIIDFTLNINQKLEKITKDITMLDIKRRFKDMMFGIHSLQYKSINFRIVDELTTIADYRRKFNDEYCDKVDVLIWGESDSLLPKEIFIILDNLHRISVGNNNSKYLSFFGTCKMWDESWNPVEHNKFTDKPVDNKKWWGTRYVMSIDEMNEINNGVEELDVRIVSPHKFNGCGLIISSEVVRAGVNIPKSVFFVHEDTAFMLMTNKILGNIPQYVIKNILLVHNREHPKKRMYVKGEEGTSLGERRNSSNWYTIANKMSEQNCYNLFNNDYKSFTWGDVWKKIK